MVLNIIAFGGYSINLTLLLLLIVIICLTSFRLDLSEAKPLSLSANEWNGNYTLLGTGRGYKPSSYYFGLRNSNTLRQQQATSLQAVNSATVDYYQQQQARQTTDNYLNNLSRVGTSSGLPIKPNAKKENSTNIKSLSFNAPITPLINPHGASLRKALLSLQNPRLFGGDILIRTGARRRGGRLTKYERSALVNQVSLWPGGVIYYELHSSVAHLKDLIWKVMQQFHDETCIRFIPRLHNEPDFLHIESVRGCFSYIGRIGGEQTLSLSDGCEYKGTIAHELLHAVGFYHHQNRSDRDEFLEIVWENIAKGKENQFHKMEPQENLLLNEFDYDSIMLYGPHTFGRTLDKVTMKPKREGVILLEVVEKQGLSLIDIDSVNKLYKCKPYD